MLLVSNLGKQINIQVDSENEIDCNGWTLEQWSERLGPGCFQAISPLCSVQMIVNQLVQNLSHVELTENLNRRFFVRTV